jgi:hypothetical protein
MVGMGFIGKNRVYKDILLGVKRVVRSLATGNTPPAAGLPFRMTNF